MKLAVKVLEIKLRREHRMRAIANVRIEPVGITIRHLRVMRSDRDGGMYLEMPYRQFYENFELKSVKIVDFPPDLREMVKREVIEAYAYAGGAMVEEEQKNSRERSRERRAAAAGALFSAGGVAQAPPALAGHLGDASPQTAPVGGSSG